MNLQQTSICEVLCCNRGIMQNEKCYCDFGYFGDQCETNIEDIYTPQYYIQLGLYCILFLYSLIASLSQMYTQLSSKNQYINMRKQQFILAIIDSPININITLVILFSIIKLIKLILDPFNLFLGNLLIINRILSDIAYTILFFIYGYLLISWYSMFDEISFISVSHSQQRKWIFQHYKIFVKIRQFLVLLIQLAVSIFNGLRKEQIYSSFMYFCYTFLLINFLLFIIEFSFYGIQLKQCIQNQINFCQNQKIQKLQKLQTQIEKLQQQYYSEGPKMDEDQENQQPFQSGQQPQLFLKIIDQFNDNQEISQGSQSESNESKESLKINEMRQSVVRKSGKNVTFSQVFDNQQHFRQESHKLIPMDEQKEQTKKHPLKLNIRKSREQQILDDSCCLKDSAKEYEWKQLDSQIINQAILKQIDIVKDTKQNLNKNKKNLRIYSQKEQKKQIDGSFSEQSGNQFQTQNTFAAQQLVEHIQLQEMEENSNYVFKSNSLNTDQQILAKITIMITFGILFEILFAIMSVIVLTTSFIYKPVGTIIYYYISSMLQFLSLLVVLKLFKDIKNQQVNHLIWIQKLGNKNNTVNQQYQFTIPEEERRQDEMLQKFENRINIKTTQ